MNPQSPIIAAPATEVRTLRPATVHATSDHMLDEAVHKLREGATTFARLSISERIELALSMQAGYLRIAEQSVRAACASKGLTSGTPAEGEEWATGPWCVVRHLRLVAESLASLQRTGNTPIGKVRRSADDTLAVGLFPSSAVDRVLHGGITADAYMLSGIGESELRDSRAGFYRGRAHDGRTVLVLGAGNLAAIPAMDVITKMFNEGKACLLKMNPVNAYLGPFMAQAFGEAIRRNFLAIVYGGVQVGAYLAHHTGIDEVHLTGSAQTYDAILWGSTEQERNARKARNAPLLSKTVTAELGNVTPVLVVPGPYSDKELAFQAESIAGGVVYNASFNCNAPKMLVTPMGWRRRGAVLSALERVFDVTPLRRAYYPEAERRWRQLTEGRSQLRTIGVPASDELPWTLMPGLDATDLREPAFGTEPFCSILSETEVGCEDPIEFLERAVDFANHRLWGTLSAQLVVHPTSLKDKRIGAAIERAIARLRYGSVAVNGWNGMTFAYGSLPWGAYPGSNPLDIQSGNGWVHNTSMLEGVEKIVVRHPLVARTKPATFPSHRSARTLLKRLTYQDERGGWGGVPGVIAAAVRG
ncbi:MAG: aldehyde dehydrogenase family protein [Gemmatimonadota bacterium]